MATQQTLEETLAEVEELRRGLGAEISVGGHEEEGLWVGGSRGGNSPGYYEIEPGWVKDYVPDTQKQEEARQKLQQVYETSEWYSVRYAAGRALGKNREELFSKFMSIINNLKEDLSAGEMVEIPGQLPISTTQYGPPLEEFIPDMNKFSRAFEFLDDIYNNIPDKRIREEAGKSLGYSSSKIWNHEHPIKAIVRDAAIAAGVTSGLGYMLYQYMTR